MPNGVFCISAARTVGRAQTSHLAHVQLSAQPPPTPCLSSIPVFEGRHLNIAAHDRHLALQKYLQRGEESIFDFGFGGTCIIYCFQIYKIWSVWVVLLLYNITSWSRAKAEHIKVPMRPSGHIRGTVVPPAHTCTATLGDISPVSEGALHAKCKGSSPPTMLHSSRGQHYKTQSSIKSTSETLEQVYSKCHSREVSFPKAFLRTGGHSSQLLPPPGCGWRQFRCSQVASSITAHQPWECGC